MNMKKLLTFITLMVFTIAISVAYADEIIAFGSNKDIGTFLYEDAFAARDTVLADKEAASSTPGGDEIPLFGSNKDIGTMLYEDAFAVPETAMAGRDARGSAAGGVANVDENTRIWDTLLSPVGGSDLP
jgi:hypothetical protein